MIRGRPTDSEHVNYSTMSYTRMLKVLLTSFRGLVGVVGDHNLSR